MSFFSTRTTNFWSVLGAPKATTDACLQSTRKFKGSSVVGGIPKLLLSVIFLLETASQRILNNFFFFHLEPKRSRQTNNIKLTMLTSQPSSPLSAIQIKFCCFKRNALLSCSISWHFFTLPFSMELIDGLIFSSISLFASKQILILLKFWDAQSFQKFYCNASFCQGILVEESLQTLFNCFLYCLGSCACDLWNNLLFNLLIHFVNLSSLLIGKRSLLICITSCPNQEGN